jgi:hypothetical protein
MKLGQYLYSIVGDWAKSDVRSGFCPHRDIRTQHYVCECCKQHCSRIVAFGSMFFFTLTAVCGLFLNAWYPSADPAGLSPVKLYSETGMTEVFARYKV